MSPFISKDDNIDLPWPERDFWLPGHSSDDKSVGWKNAPTMRPRMKIFLNKRYCHCATICTIHSSTNEEAADCIKEALHCSLFSEQFKVLQWCRRWVTDCMLCIGMYHNRMKSLGLSQHSRGVRHELMGKQIWRFTKTTHINFHSIVRFRSEYSSSSSNTWTTYIYLLWFITALLVEKVHDIQDKELMTITWYW